MRRARGAPVPQLPLSIAGSDPTGGAGLEADLKVFLAHGLSGCAVATALTVQDTRAVHAVEPVSARLVRRRLDALLDDVAVGGVKIGLLPGKDVVSAVARVLRERAPRFVVLDPVLAPTRGRAFLDRAGRAALIDRLLPLADLVMPTAAAAAALLGAPAAWVARHPARATAALREAGARAVLLKGGDGRGADAVDLLDAAGTHRAFALPRIRGAKGSCHGTGCALASAILANLLRGAPLPRAVERAKLYVHAAMRRARAIGRGRFQLGFADGAVSSRLRRAASRRA
jgi:hydroxymethylpyrimidine/phosphomethylpyrimidine kinase